MTFSQHDDRTALDELAMGSDPEVVQALETLVSSLVEEVPTAELLEQVLHLTEHAIPTSAAISVTAVGDEGRYHTAASTDPDATVVDRLQYELQEGPCIDALESGTERICEDLGADPRWPGFSERAKDLGFTAVLAQPLRVDAGVVGALNVFVRAPDELSEADRQVARRVAVPAAATLTNARAFQRARRLQEQLTEAARSRAVIEQAKGIVMATRGCDPAEAFEVLRTVSQTSNRKLRDVAEQLVRRAAEPPPT